MTEMTTGCEKVHPIRLTAIGEDARCPCGLRTLTWEKPDDLGISQIIARVESASGQIVRLSGLPEALAAARGAL